MAQKTGNEEMELKIVPEAVSLCVKCGVSGVSGVSGANNLCQKCFNATAATSGAEKSFRSGSNPRSSTERKAIPAEARPDLKKEFDLTPVTREVNRCSGCQRKVGLTGFRCRCGDLFCADHRYSDRHSCSYDYKSAAREVIARENPVVKAAKIVRI